MVGVGGHSAASPVCPDEADGITPGHDGLGHFAGGLVEHLVAQMTAPRASTVVAWA
jgi:hypothetical protein